MNTLVTGATGLIGQHLVQRLVQEGHSVRALIRPGRDGAWLEAMGVELYRGDVSDRTGLASAMQGCQQVFHLAALVHGHEVTRSSLWTVNVQGTENVAQAALQAGIDRLIYTSSVAIYGRMIRNRSITEETPPRPDSPYGESKLLTETMLQAHYQRDGLPVVIVRPSTVFGSGAISWLGLFQAIANQQFRLIGSGNGYHHITDVSDIADGLWRCSITPGIEGRCYNLAGREPVSLREFISLISEAIGCSTLAPPLPGAPLQVYKLLDQFTYTLTGQRLPKADRLDLFLGDRCYDLSRARQELGYDPQVTPTELIHRTVAWFRQQGYSSFQIN